MDMHAVFMAEANEIMTDLEVVMLRLETDPANKEAIDQVFRSLHTLKGSAGMFGLEAVNRLAHQLESVYEGVRSGRHPATPEVLRVTFACIDHLKGLLADTTGTDPHLLSMQHALLQEIAVVSTALETVPVPASESKEPEAKWYYILFVPRPNLLRTGTNTLYVVDDLLALGTGLALPFLSERPVLQGSDPAVELMCFEVLLHTARSVQEIREVFLFVEKGSTLDIRPMRLKEDVLSEETQQRLWDAHAADKPLGLDAIDALLMPAAERGEMNTAVPMGPRTTQAMGSTVRVGSDRIDELLNLVSELVTTQARLSLHSELAGSGELTAISENVENITRRLRDNAFGMSMVPIESLVVRFQRLVRDLSKELDKEVEFTAQGADTQIDKSIIEKLTDPLLHLLRNAMDHGIETRAERLRKGKPAAGHLHLRSYSSGANVIIEIGDDGAGIDLERVRNKAVANGLIAQDALLSEAELIDLIFMPGFSTAEKVSDVSGRGVGMDVVRRNISDIRGDIRVNTTKDAGTTFTIRLPLTLSIIDGLLVRIGRTDFILPLTAVNKCYEVPTIELESAFNQWITLDGERTPYFHLRRDLAIADEVPELSQLIRVAHEGSYVGLVVDRIIGEHQAVLKPLGQLYRTEDEYAGATILGDGSVALVMDPYRMIGKWKAAHQQALRAS